MKTLITDITELEFLTFVKKIYNADYDTEEAHTHAVLEFERISEHPSGSDLLFYPDIGKSGPEAIVKEIKEWRAANEKPGFKQL